MNAADFPNARIGDGTVLEPNVEIGFRYHPDCGETLIGERSIIRMGTIIYGDVTLGRFFQSGHYSVIRARVTAGDHFALGNHSTLEGLIEIGDGVRIMSHVYVPSRTRIGNHVRIEPLPPEVDRPNHRSLTEAELDLWHPEGPSPGEVKWD